MKKFISLALAASMVASMSVSAFAFNTEPLADKPEYNVDDVRISRRTMHRSINDGVRIMFFPFEVKGNLITANTSATKDIVDGATGRKPVYFSDIKDFQELTYTVKMDPGCEKYLRVVEPLHDIPSFIVLDQGEGNGDAIKNPTNEDSLVDMTASPLPQSSGKNVIYAEMEGFKIVLNENNSTENVPISGTITLKHKGKKLDEYKFRYNYKNLVADTDDMAGRGAILIDNGRYEVVPLTKDYSFLDRFASEVNGDTATIDLRGTNRSIKIVDFGKDVEEIELEDHNGFSFNVKASNQGKVNLTYENGIQFSPMWVAMFRKGQELLPAGADVRYFNFKAKPEFDFTGKATIELPDPDVQWYLYNLDPNQMTWSPVEHAVLTEDGDAFEFKTRKLGCYMLSDMEIPMPNNGTEGEVENNVNPETGGPRA